MIISKFKMSVLSLSVFFIIGTSGCYNSGTVSENIENKNVVKPNIIFILADDLGYADIGVYGQEKITTHHLDQMAKQGTMFTDFYSGSTVCAPSRAVLMTGKHLGHNRIRGNGKNESQMLLPHDFTVAEMLKNAGYSTALIGKWGLGDIGSTGTPDKQGFDHYFGFLNQVHAHNHYPEWLWRNGEKVKLNNIVEPIKRSYTNFIGGVAKPENRKDYAGDLFLNESIEYIEKQSKASNPFFLYLAVTTPHANNEADMVDWAHGMEVPNYDKYADTSWPEAQKGYAAMVDHLDKSVGTILSKLRELNIDDNTIVIFTSDNGPHAEAGNIPEYFDSNGKYRGIKRDLYDGGIRVPMIVWGPGLIAENKVTEHISYFGDFMATAAEFAGVAVPENTDSVSFLPSIVKENKEQKQHDHLYWEFYEHGSRQAIRKDNWKAVRQPMFTGNIELYDLTTDAEENIDVSSQHPELVKEFELLFTAAHVNDPAWKIK
ncbi:arylsulfatase [Pseudocolwellia agarivorans]|uniref:arylsulfatase n=1 Tax=Pseudocolwellia agarivorans TaxID=1911682 RepID=UPI001C37687B|nr:arylsulfatase [Pseudocolwellia agarivorans]